MQKIIKNKIKKQNACIKKKKQLKKQREQLKIIKIRKKDKNTVFITLTFDV